VVVVRVVAGRAIAWKATGMSLDDILGGGFLVGLFLQKQFLLEE